MEREQFSRQNSLLGDKVFSRAILYFYYVLYFSFFYTPCVELTVLRLWYSPLFFLLSPLSSTTYLPFFILQTFLQKVKLLHFIKLSLCQKKKKLKLVISSTVMLVNDIIFTFMALGASRTQQLNSFIITMK